MANAGRTILFAAQQGFTGFPPPLSGRHGATVSADERDFAGLREQLLGSCERSDDKHCEPLDEARSAERERQLLT